VRREQRGLGGWLDDYFSKATLTNRFASIIVLPVALLTTVRRRHRQGTRGVLEIQSVTTPMKPTLTVTRISLKSAWQAVSLRSALMRTIIFASSALS
jgi:hypothetical protein